MKTFFKSLILIGYLLPLGAAAQGGASVSVSGSWSSSAAGLLSEAGQNYGSHLTSATSQSLVTVTGGNPLPSWTVVVQKQDLFWHSNLSIWVRKTGDGNCSGGGCVITPSGTSAYIQLQNSTQTLFTGTRNRSDVPLQYEIRGLSVLVPVNTYTANVVYTLLEM